MLVVTGLKKITSANQDENEQNSVFTINIQIIYAAQNYFLYKILPETFMQI